MTMAHVKASFVSYLFVSNRLAVGGVVDPTFKTL
jgi:hypothetical protein